MLFTILFAFLCLLMLEQNDSALLKDFCPQNMTFKDCGTLCPERCEDDGPRACFRLCVGDVCQCKKGYVLDSTGRCIKRVDCGKRIDPPPLPLNESCPENTVPSECASTCPELCFAKGERKNCLSPCIKNECECKAPYAYDIHGKCVLKDKCDRVSTHRCYGDMVYSLCPSLYEKTCATLRKPSNAVFCGPARCICKPGYVRIKGDCYKKSVCERLRRKKGRHLRVKSSRRRE